MEVYASDDRKQQDAVQVVAKVKRPSATGGRSGQLPKWPVRMLGAGRSLELEAWSQHWL